MNTLKFAILGLALVSVFGCASKKPQSDISASGAAMLNADPLTFSPGGSDSGKIAGLNTIHFDFDRAVLDAEARAQIEQNASWIKAHPELKVQIEGHCDARGSVEYNLALGDRRAKAVQNVLMELGISKDHLATISYGEEKPIASGDSDEAYAKNRRANFVPLKMEQTAVAPLAAH
jgi:peptidoglycan-associated lipoprotein